MNAAAVSARPRRNTLTAICYRCEYTSLDATLTRCPLCDFAIILEAGNLSLFGGSPAEAEQAETPADDVSLFGGGEAAGPPAKVLRLPLPGLDAEAERAARRELERTRRRLRRPSSAGGTSLLAEEPAAAWRRAGLAVAVLSAMLAGMLFIILGGAL